MMQVQKQGFNATKGGYDRLVNAGTYRIEQTKRTNVLGHGIMATGDHGMQATTFTVQAAMKLIAQHAVSFAFKQMGDKVSLLVVWRVRG